MQFFDVCPGRPRERANYVIVKSLSGFFRQIEPREKEPDEGK